MYFISRLKATLAINFAQMKKYYKITQQSSFGDTLEERVLPRFFISKADAIEYLNEMRNPLLHHDPNENGMAAVLPNHPSYVIS